MYLGKLKESQQLAQRASSCSSSRTGRERRECFVSLAGNMVVVGKCQQAKDNVSAAMALSRGEMLLSGAACLRRYAAMLVARSR
jgi:hypothetical protein